MGRDEQTSRNSGKKQLASQVLPGNRHAVAAPLPASSEGIRSTWKWNPTGHDQRKGTHTTASPAGILWQSSVAAPSRFGTVNVYIDPAVEWQTNPPTRIPFQSNGDSLQ